MAENFEVALSADNRAAIVQFNDDEGNKFTKTFDAVDLEYMVRDLALLRAQMEDGVPGALEPQFRIDTIHGPAWRIPEIQNGPEGKILVLRHPGYGWLAFHLEPTRAQQIGTELLK